MHLLYKALHKITLGNCFEQSSSFARATNNVLINILPQVLGTNFKNKNDKLKNLTKY